MLCTALWPPPLSTVRPCPPYTPRTDGTFHARLNFLPICVQMPLIGTRVALFPDLHTTGISPAPHGPFVCPPDHDFMCQPTADRFVPCQWGCCHVMPGSPVGAERTSPTVRPCPPYTPCTDGTFHARWCTVDKGGRGFFICCLRCILSFNA